MNPIKHIRQQLELALDLLNRNQIDECFELCKEIQQGIDALRVDESDAISIKEINEQLSTILRQLNIIMVERIKENKYQHK